MRIQRSFHTSVFSDSLEQRITLSAANSLIHACPAIVSALCRSMSTILSRIPNRIQVIYRPTILRSFIRPYRHLARSVLDYTCHNTNCQADARRLDTSVGLSE